MSANDRAAIELGLLIQLAVVLTVAGQQLDKPELCGVAIAPEPTFRMTLLGSFDESLPLLKAALAIATQWVDAVEAFLSIL